MTALRSTALVLCFVLAAAGSTLAGPPLATDDASTVDPGKVEIELNGAYSYNKEEKNCAHAKTTTVTGELKTATGLYPNLGISLSVPYTFTAHTHETDGIVTKDLRGDGFGDMKLDVKYRFAELGGINLAIKPSILIPTGKYSAGLSEGRWQSGGTLITTKEFAEGRYALHANLGYEYRNCRLDDGSQRKHIWSGSLAGEALIAEGLVAVADFGLSSNPDKTSYELPVYALTGLRYAINDHLDINAGVKFGLTRPETDVTALYGLVLKF